MCFPHAAPAQIQYPNINKRVFLDKPFCVVQCSADRDARRFEVVKAAVLESLWNASGREENIGASIGLAAARSGAFAVDELPSAA
jgi:hypothetical protein